MSCRIAQLHIAVHTHNIALICVVHLEVRYLVSLLGLAA